MDDYARLSAVMNQRRLDLGLQWKQIAAAAGITVGTLTAVREGKNRPTDLTKRNIERALEWEPGSFDTLREGGDPTPAGSIDDVGSMTDAMLDEIQRDPAKQARLRRILQGRPDESGAASGGKVDGVAG